MAFLHLVKVVRDDFEYKCQIWTLFIEAKLLVRLANRGRLLLRTPGPVPFGTCICSNVETILSWTCHIYGPFEFRTSLGTPILLCRLIWTVCTTCAISLLLGIMNVTKTSTVESEYSKTTKDHQKLITKRIRKAPYLAQYTKVGKVIKRFRRAAFTDLDQWQFVLKLSGHLSFIILDLCTK